MAGIFGPKQPANADIQALINSVQNAVIEQVGQTNLYIAVAYIVQNVVGGTNWVVKVRIGERITDSLHLMINQIVNVQM